MSDEKNDVARCCPDVDIRPPCPHITAYVSPEPDSREWWKEVAFVAGRRLHETTMAVRAALERMGPEHGVNDHGTFTHTPETFAPWCPRCILLRAVDPAWNKKGGAP